MTTPDSPVASGSSGDELADLLFAELEDAGDAATTAALPEEEEEEEQPASKRQKLPGARGGACPPHPGFMGGLCIRCGALKSTETGPVDEGTPIALKYIHHGLEVSRCEADRLRAGTVQRALSSRRLLLVLDLDHTLLHSTRLPDVNQEQTQALHGIVQSQSQEDPLLYYLPHMTMWTKLRPGVRQFLAAAHELFDLHVFTMGDRHYAAGMAKILDPEGKLFGGRVASSSDAGTGMVKDIDVLLGAEEMVLILDDTAGVWPKHRDNLLQIERYIYFPACAVRFGRGGNSLFEKNLDEDPDLGALACSLKVMAEVHSRFFKQIENAAAGEGKSLEESKEGEKQKEASSVGADVRVHLRDIRAKILEGCCILFSRVIPVDMEPSSHPLWQLATQIGAECVSEMSDRVTHVVASDMTEKTRWAETAGKRVVSPNWLWCCAFSWEHSDESRFPLAAGNGEQPGVRSEDADLAAAIAAAGGGG